MRLVMMGTGSFAEPAFRALLATPHFVVGLVTQPDQETGSVRSSTRRALRSAVAMPMVWLSQASSLAPVSKRRIERK